MRLNYKTTMFSCFVGYIVQAVVNNFAPLLVVMFQDIYGIPLSKITLLVTVNFLVQLTVDLLGAGFIDKIGYRASILTAHACSSAGFLLLTVLPEVMDPFAGILLSVIVYAVGGGIIEVLISPIMESCPTEHKEKAMSLLHSFYCWGHVGVVLLSTLFFRVFGLGQWRILALLWAVLPLLNGAVFIKTPIAPLISSGEKGMTVKELFGNSMFWLFMIMMACSGASELSVSQWASAFAERALGISKTAGDLAGPMAFAVLMGSARVFYGKYGEKINLGKFMIFSSSFCILAYLLMSAAPSPLLSLFGCALSGISVGILWPGTFSKASASLRGGGTAMFAMLALAGDLGCSAGPSLVGAVSDLWEGDMRRGILAAAVFPVLLTLCLLAGFRKNKI